MGDDGRTTTREVGHESRQAIKLALQPMVLHRYVLALDVAGLVEALAERGNKLRMRQSGIDEADHRHCRLLRARRDRPSSRRTSEQRDELTSFHCDDPKPKDGGSIAGQGSAPQQKQPLTVRFGS